MKKLLLLASLLGSVACHMPPETGPRPQTRIIYIYETSRYGRDYGYNSRYDDCWMRMSSLYCQLENSRYQSRMYLPIRPFIGNRVEPPRQHPIQPPKGEPRRAEPRGQHPQTPRVGPPPGRSQLPRMGPQGHPSQPPRGEPRRAEPRPQPPQQPPSGGAPPIVPPSSKL